MSSNEDFIRKKYDDGREELREKKSRAALWNFTIPKNTWRHI
jgi:hypothetical protein